MRGLNGQVELAAALSFHYQGDWCTLKIMVDYYFHGNLCLRLKSNLKSCIFVATLRSFLPQLRGQVLTLDSAALHWENLFSHSADQNLASKLPLHRNYATLQTRYKPICLKPGEVVFLVYLLLTQRAGYSSAKSSYTLSSRNNSKNV